MLVCGVCWVLTCSTIKTVHLAVLHDHGTLRSDRVSPFWRRAQLPAAMARHFRASARRSADEVMTSDPRCFGKCSFIFSKQNPSEKGIFEAKPPEEPNTVCQPVRNPRSKRTGQQIPLPRKLHETKIKEAKGPQRQAMLKRKGREQNLEKHKQETLKSI